MRNPLNRMPWGLRVAFGFFTAGVFAFIGVSFWESARVVAYLLIGLSVMRAYAAVRMAMWFLGSDDEEPPETKGVAWDDVQKELDTTHGD